MAQDDILDDQNQVEAIIDRNRLSHAVAKQTDRDKDMALLSSIERIFSQESSTYNML